MGDLILALGSNVPGRLGPPETTLVTALSSLADEDMTLKSISSFYRSAPVGAHYQPSFLNLVIRADCHMPLYQLFSRLKQLEARAGRRGRLFWGARPLDIDIIDYNGSVLNWRDFPPAGRAERYGILRLPHRLMHQRSFVLKPLVEIWPGWRHPVFELDAAHLLRLHCAPLMVKHTEKLEFRPKL